MAYDYCIESHLLIIKVTISGKVDGSDGSDKSDKSDKSAGSDLVRWVRGGGSVVGEVCQYASVD